MEVAVSVAVLVFDGVPISLGGGAAVSMRAIAAGMQFGGQDQEKFCAPFLPLRGRTWLRHRRPAHLSSQYLLRGVFSSFRSLSFTQS